MPEAIRTEHLCRTYSRPRRKRGRFDFLPFVGSRESEQLIALDNVTLEVREGELFGLLGPNGAGKTTLIKILTTLLAPSAGQAWVDGIDVMADPYSIRPRINMVSGGESSGYGPLNVRENLWLFTQIYGVPTSVAMDRIEHLLDVVDLRDKATTRLSYLSTGQRQKMNFARGFLTDPKILFLDEPTLGLDVSAARRIRTFIREWMAERPNRTMLLTTHYMAEADELCDRIAIIHGGKVLACDTPTGLKKTVQQYPIFELSLEPGRNGYAELNHLAGVHQATCTETPTTVEVKVALDEEGAVGSVVQSLVAGGSRIRTLRKVEPTLEDVFIELVGRSLSDVDAPTP